MMNNKDFIDAIYKKYNDSETINDKFYKQKIGQKNHVPVYLIIACVCIIAISSSISFADNYLNFFKKSGTATVENNEIEMAIKDNYIQNVDMNYCKSKKVGVKVDSISMDSNRLYIVLNFQFDKSLQDNFDNFLFQDILITDDNNNLIFSFDNKIYQDFCKKHNIDITQKKIYKTSFSYNIIHKSKKNATYIYYFNTDDIFPKSKKLCIFFNSLILLSGSEDHSNLAANKVINGKWNLELNIKDSFYNRKSTLYTNKLDENLGEINLSINNITSTLVFNNSTNFQIEDIYIKDEKNNKYNMQNFYALKKDKITSDFDLPQDIKDSSLILHIKTNIFEKDIILKKE